MQTQTAATATTIKTYTVKDTWKGYEVTLEVNHSVLTEERAALINEFWTSHEDRVEHLNGDVVKAVIQMFGQNAICLYLNENGASFGDSEKWLINKCSKDLRAEEGWGGESNDGNDLFGWCGIRIVGADVTMPEYEEMELWEVLT
ncbi:hypothetical protein D3C77_248530 [compost metagenome]